MAVQLVVLCEGVDKPRAIALRARGGAGGLMRTGPDGEEHDAKEDHDYRMRNGDTKPNAYAFGDVLHGDAVRAFAGI
jgi:hypothetical protein